MLLPDRGNTFAEQLKDLTRIFISTIGGFQKYHVVCARIYLSDAQNQYEQLIKSELYNKHLANIPRSIVEQTPLVGYKIALHYKISKSTGGEEFLFQPYRLTPEEARNGDVYQQTLTLFNRYIADMTQRGLANAANLVRTWIYVDDIDHNYAEMVRARNDVFARHGLTPNTHFVASTGIGGATEQRDARVAIDFLTYPGIKESDKTYIKAPEFLNATHEYGVAFERGVRLQTPSETKIFISGTAAIDKKGKAVARGNVMKQLGRIFDNLNALLTEAGSDLDCLDYLTVYLRDAADHDPIIKELRRWDRRLPILIFQAKVCRPEWLIEIEGVAHKRERATLLSIGR